MTLRFLSIMMVSLFGLGLGLQANAEIVLRPGSRIVIENPGEIVSCQDERPRFFRYCKCEQMGFSQEIQLLMVLDKDGNYDSLGSFDSRLACEKSMSRHPSCRAYDTDH